MYKYTHAMFPFSGLWLPLYANRGFVLSSGSLRCLLACGCCHAHSNCSADSFEGKPCTIICITHGLLRDVFHAPAVSSPLCCLSVCTQCKLDLKTKEPSKPTGYVSADSECSLCTFCALLLLRGPRFSCISLLTQLILVFVLT